MTHTAKHTPGPWFFEVDAVEEGIVIRDAHRNKLAYLLNNGNANAKLIAAAPDMAEALKGMLSAFAWEAEGSGSIRDAVINKARASLAKAGVE